MTPQLKHCLFNEMKISKYHFEEKYNGFPSNIRAVIDHQLLQMHTMSKSIRDGNTVHSKFNDLYYEAGDENTNEFLQALFDCFKEWQLYDGLQLQKKLYEHTNRGTDNWFPLVVIDQKINSPRQSHDVFTVYRGCHKDEVINGDFQYRQSWSTDINVAKAFAFQHPPSSSSLQSRIVLQATVKATDILWDRGTSESEMVLKEGFTPLTACIKMTYDEYVNITSD